MDDNPRNISPPNRIELFDLRRVGFPEKGSQLYIDLADNRGGQLLDRSSTEKVWNLFSELPSDEQARCHIPPFGFKVVDNEQCYFEATICWSCNNIFGRLHGQQWGYTFSGEADASQELLAVFHHYFGVHTVHESTESTSQRQVAANENEVI